MSFSPVYTTCLPEEHDWDDGRYSTGFVWKKAAKGFLLLTMFDGIMRVVPDVYTLSQDCDERHLCSSCSKVNPHFYLEGVRSTFIQGHFHVPLFPIVGRKHGVCG